MNLETLAWVTLGLPLLSAAVIVLGTQRDRELSARISIGAVAAGLALSSLLLLVYVSQGRSPAESNLTWLAVGPFQAQIGVRLDGLSLLMLVVVTGVGTVIHVFSLGYMTEDRGFSRFFAGLSLFTFSMIGIVLSTNFIELFIFWELVGLSSYLLIGFWYARPAAADAAKKAFLTNRLGDLGFLIGILMVWSLCGSLHFATIHERLSANGALLGPFATWVGLLLCCGAAGKSAQFPLHVWLPDAMEGPTPVSALIHAATMVAAGVYMLCRIFFLLNGTALEVVAWVGAITSLLAGLIAIQQNDLKRILAYSTLSQLGYMIMAVGLHAPGAAMFHLTTHAFFKALLFLGAGSVIVALHHEQDIWNMGGLRKRMPTTYWTFLVGTLALCGIPPLSGFFSKDAILMEALSPAHGSGLLFGIGITVALLTPFYMFRLLGVAFLGPARSKAASAAKESPRVMTVPLILLAVASSLAGFIGIEAYVNATLGLETPHDPGAGLLVMAFSGLAIVLGASLSGSLYFRARKDPLPDWAATLTRYMRHRFYFDELNSALIDSTHEALARVAAWFDRWVVSSLVIRGGAGMVDIAGRTLRMLQSGGIHAYAFLLVAGVVVILYWMRASLAI